MSLPRYAEPMIGWPKHAVVTHDEDAYATYIKLEDSPVASTRLVSDSIHVDLGSRGQVVGIEILDADND